MSYMLKVVTIQNGSTQAAIGPFIYSGVSVKEVEWFYSGVFVFAPKELFCGCQRCFRALG